MSLSPPSMCWIESMQKQSIDHQVTNWDSEWQLNKDYITITIQTNTRFYGPVPLPTSDAGFCLSLISGKEHSSRFQYSWPMREQNFSPSSNEKHWFSDHLFLGIILSHTIESQWLPPVSLLSKLQIHYTLDSSTYRAAALNIVDSLFYPNWFRVYSSLETSCSRFLSSHDPG